MTRIPQRYRQTDGQLTALCLASHGNKGALLQNCASGKLLADFTYLWVSVRLSFAYTHERMYHGGFIYKWREISLKHCFVMSRRRNVSDDSSDDDEGTYYWLSHLTISFLPMYTNHPAPQIRRVSRRHCAIYKFTYLLIMHQFVTS